MGLQAAADATPRDPAELWLRANDPDYQAAAKALPLVPLKPAVAAVLHASTPVPTARQFRDEHGEAFVAWLMVHDCANAKRSLPAFGRPTCIQPPREHRPLSAWDFRQSRRSRRTVGRQ